MELLWDYNAIITDIEGKIPSITVLATASGCNGVENKIPNVNGLVRKTDDDVKISDIETKYLTTSDYNKYKCEILNAKIKEKKLVDKFDISGFTDNSDLDKKEAALATKAELKPEEDKKVKLQAFDSSYFRGKSHFDDIDTQNYILLQSIYNFLKRIANSNYISTWKSKELSHESIKSPAASNNSPALALNHNIKLRAKLDGYCLKQEKLLFTHKQVVNIFNSYGINLRPYDILILGKGPADDLGDTTLTVEKEYLIKFYWRTEEILFKFAL